MGRLGNLVLSKVGRPVKIPFLGVVGVCLVLLPYWSNAVTFSGAEPTQKICEFDRAELEVAGHGALYVLPLLDKQQRHGLGDGVPFCAFGQTHVEPPSNEGANHKAYDRAPDCYQPIWDILITFHFMLAFVNVLWIIYVTDFVYIAKDWCLFLFNKLTGKGV
jgi:hypothetical protein